MTPGFQNRKRIKTIAYKLMDTPIEVEVSPANTTAENVKQMVINTEAPGTKFSASKFDYTVLINFENSCCNVF